MTIAMPEENSARGALAPRLGLVFILLVTCLVTAMSLVRTSEGLSQGYQYSRPDLSHPAVSLNLGYALAYCGQYSNSAGIVDPAELATLQNHERFTQGRQVDCSSTQPSFAAENGFSLIVAGGLWAGYDTPFKLGVFLTVLKYVLIAIAGAMALPVFGGWAALSLTAATLGWAYWDEAYFYASRLFLDFHALEPYVWLVAVMFCIWTFHSALSEKIGWRHWTIVVVASLSMLFLRLLRSSDFYIQEVALIIIALCAAWFLKRDRRKLLVAVTSILIVVAAPMALGAAHANWLEHRACAAIGGDPATCARVLVNVEHPIWHPIVLGLAVPPSPISEKFGFEWASDSETLKPAQFINPAVDKLYTPEFSKALKDFYVYIWTNLTHETIATYLAKFGVLYSIGWPVMIFGMAGVIMGLWFGSLPTLFFSLLFVGKALESTLIYPPYWSLYHQSAGVLAIGVVVASLVAFCDRRMWKSRKV
ncbi:MAG TPA: hypothetical protein VL147_18450 [Devosia sp.]|nr:hypothetical protein [Devosia sp.]